MLEVPHRLDVVKKNIYDLLVRGENDSKILTKYAIHLGFKSQKA